MSICDNRFHVISEMLSMAKQLSYPLIPRAVIKYDDDDLAFARAAITRRRGQTAVKKELLLLLTRVFSAYYLGSERVGLCAV